MGEIHGGSMLHVLPAGTYGLRPAVNRSNTRTWRATLRTGDCARCRWLARFLTLSLVPLSSPIFLLSTADYLRKYVLPDFKLLHRGRGTRVFSRTSDKYNKAYKYRIFRAIHASTSYNPMNPIQSNRRFLGRTRHYLPEKRNEFINFGRI